MSKEAITLLCGNCYNKGSLEGYVRNRPGLQVGQYQGRLRGAETRLVGKEEEES